MVDGFSLQISFLIFEGIFCFLSALVYGLSRDPLRQRKHIVISLNVTCGAMLICECLFYVYSGSSSPADILISRIVNAGVYYLIVMLLLLYLMLVTVRLFSRFDIKPDMPCRKRVITICAMVIIGIILITVSQFNGMYYYFDADNIYHRGSLFWLAAVVPTLGVLIIASIIIQYRDRISRSQEIVLLSYLVLPIAGEAFQMLFFGNSLMNICIGLSVLMMFFENAIHKEKELAVAARTEARTGLANEHGYIEWLNSMKGDPNITSYAAVFFDLRSFSDINRKYGVENGNRVLAGYGNILLGLVSKDEILGRQFGNQFVAIVKKENLQIFLDALSKVDVTFTDSESGEEKTVTLRARAGVYMIDRTDLEGEDILVFAGQALNAAKSKDNEDVVMLTPEFLQSIAERKKLESDIITGLNAGQFRPYYQPKVNISTGLLCGAEALSRWNRNGEIVFPGTYIPIMEANDTIRLLDQCILKAVCEDISAWLKEGLSVPPISVNFSRRNLVDPDIASRIDSIVEAAGVPKDLIEIEVTESSDEFSFAELNDFVESLHKLGYKVSIDDFGSASSSLTLLREIYFDTLKIDKGFIDHAKERDITILTYIIKMAESIGTGVVAEGVEQKIQIATLTALGVDTIQGYLFDKPLPPSEMTARLKSPSYEVG